MAYTKTPTQETMQNKQIPLLYEWETRDPTRYAGGNDVVYDADAVNVVYEPVIDRIGGDNYFEVMKRDGISSTGLTFAGTILGTFCPTFQISGYRPIVVVTTTNIYQIAYSSGPGWQIFNNQTIPILAPISTQQIGFTEFLFDSGVTKIYFYTQALYEMNLGSNTASQIVAAPTGVQVNPFPVFLDGYLFLSDNAGNIYNSQLNDPTVWPAANVATSESFPDGLSAIARVGSYLVALGSQSIEWFYDAGNATGTPLQVYTGATKRIGFWGGLVIRGETLIFTGVPYNGLPNVYQVNGLQIEAISNPNFSRRLNQLWYNSTHVVGAILSFKGHDIYMIQCWTSNLPPYHGVPNINSMGLDLETKTVCRFTYQNYPLVAESSGKFLANTATGANWLSSVFVGTYYLDPINSGLETREVLFTNPTVYQDNGVNFEVKFTTRNMDWGTRRMKFGSRLVVNADQTPATSYCYISWSDDDYQTFSTPRQVNLADKYTQLYALGSFRKRATRLTYSDNYPMRFRSLELDYDQGSA